MPEQGSERRASELRGPAQSPAAAHRPQLTDRSADFSDFGGWTFLNCAFHGPMPKVAEEALAAAVELRRNPSLIRNDYHFSFPDAYRSTIASLIGSPPSSVAIVDSTTRGMTLLAAGLDWRAGDEIVIPRGEFPANRLPWLHLGSQGVRLIEVDVAREPTVRIAESLTPRTRLVSVSWVSFTDGRRLDLGALSQVCRDRQVLFAVDGSQGVGGLPFDVGETPCDLLACSAYKWLLGPYGLGFAYVGSALIDRLASVNVNWFAIRGAEDFNHLTDLRLDFLPGAVRFDANETANFFNLAAGTAAARYIADVTPASIEAHCKHLHDRIVSGLPQGFKLLGEPEARLRSNILCISGPDPQVTARVIRFLRSRRIAVSSRQNAIRISPHVYNGEADADRFLDALSAALSSPGSDGTNENLADPPPTGGSLDARLRALIGLEQVGRASQTNPDT